MKRKKTVAYLAVKIGEQTKFKEEFKNKAHLLNKAGYIVLNPSDLPKGLDKEEYTKICNTMIEICDVFCLMPGYEGNVEINKQLKEARKHDKIIIGLYESNEYYNVI